MLYLKTPFIWELLQGIHCSEAQNESLQLSAQCKWFGNECDFQEETKDYIAHSEEH